MSFNIDFDIASLLFMIVLAFRFFYGRQFPLLSNRLFSAIIVLDILSLAFDITSTIALETCRGLDIWIPYILTSLYYAVLIIFPVTLVGYLVALMATERRVPNRVFIIGSIPALAFLVTLLVGLPMGAIFTISPTGEYGYGALSNITYACVGLYVVISLIFLAINRRHFRRIIRLAYLAMVACLLAACVLQYLMPGILLIGTAAALGTAILYFTIQDPQKMTDRETGLFNAAAARQYLLAKLNATRDFHLVALDIHDFHYNYILFGRTAGEAVLKRVAACTPNTPHVWGFRVADAMLITSFRRTEDMEAYIRAVAELRNTPIDLGEGRETTPVITTIAIPHARDLKTPDSILSTIESMLLARNIKGRLNSDVRLDSAIIQMLGRDTELEQELRKSVVTGEGLEVVYQPIYRPSTQKYVAAEVLSRYTLPSGSAVPPGIFIPVVESCNLNTPFDLKLVERVFEDLASKGFDRSTIQTVHINLSAATFVTDSIAETLNDMAQRFDIERKHVTFEMTETAASGDEEAILHAARKLHDYGFLLSLDDFGCGYSNITRLMAMPFDNVKLDKDLIQKAPDIIPQIVEIFGSLNMPVVAEGVETEAQKQMVVSCGIDCIQGYFYAKPMKVDDVIKLTAKS